MKNKNNSRSSLVINALSNWLSFFVNALIGFFLTPFIIRHVGKTGYGIWVLVGTIVGYYGLLNLGVSAAIHRYVARYTAREDYEMLNRVVNTALAMFSSIALVIVIATLVFAGQITHFFNVPPENQQNFIYLLYILGFSVSITFPAEVFGAVVVARENYLPFNIFTSINRIIYAIATIAMLSAGWGLLGIGTAQLLWAAVLFSGYLYLFKRHAGEIKISFRYANKQTLKIIITFGITSTVIMISDIIRINLDNIVIAKIVNIESVGVFGIAALLISYTTRLITGSMNVLNPRFAKLDGLGEQDNLKRLFRNSLYISSFLSFGIAMYIIIFGGNFIVLWVGTNFINAIPVLVVLTIATVLDLCQNPSIGLMYSLNKHRFYAYASVIEAILNLIFSIFLAYKYGMIGVALGTLFSAMIIRIIVMPVYTSRIINLPLVQYVKPLLPSFISAALILTGCYYFNLIDHELRYLNLIIKFLSVTVIYLVLNYFLIDKDFKAIILAKFLKKDTPAS